MNKIDLSKKNLLVYDNGLFIELAIKLSKSFNKTYYYVPWKNGFPKRNLAQVGQGIKGMERIFNFFDYVDKADLIVFPDVYDGDLQVFLSNRGYRVFGSHKGEELELYREDMKEYMKNLDLPVNKYDIVTGMKDLRKYLESHENVWVKINMFRGEFETFNSKNLKLVEPLLDSIEHSMGPMSKVQEFVVESAIDDAVEVGYDGYTIDGEFPTKGITGIEVKDVGYIGKFLNYSDMPKQVTTFNEKISKSLKKYNYRGFFSSELRITKDGKAYMIDACARAGSPPNEVYQELYSNLDEICWYGAEGKCIDPIPNGKYAVEAMIHSSWADKNWQPVEFPMKFRDNIKFRNLTIIDGKYYVVPQSVGLPEIGAIVATGDTLEETINKVKEICESVTGYYIECKADAIDQALEECKKGEEIGIKIL